MWMAEEQSGRVRLALTVLSVKPELADTIAKHLGNFYIANLPTTQFPTAVDLLICLDSRIAEHAMTFVNGTCLKLLYLPYLK